MPYFSATRTAITCRGCPFFTPLFNAGWTVHPYLPAHLDGLLDKLFGGKNFPVAFAELPADIRIRTLDPNTSILLEGDGETARLEALTANHPGWGHSAWEDWVREAERVRLPALVLAHHMPEKNGP